MKAKVLLCRLVSLGGLLQAICLHASPALSQFSEAHRLQLAGSGRLPYFVAKPQIASPDTALVVIHGHPRDAGKTLAAALKAAQLAAKTDGTLLVAPLFPVSDAQATRCHSPGVPSAQPGDALWSCRSWIEGGLDHQGNTTSFAALDRLIVELKVKWPKLQSVTVAGFSAGAQFVQHYVGFRPSTCRREGALRHSRPRQLALF